MDNFSIYQSEILNGIKGFVHAFGGKGLDTDSPEVIPETLRFLGIPPDRIFTLRQVHSAEVQVARENDLERRGSIEGDGIVCMVPGIGAAILTADCLPVIIASESCPGFVMIHCGWRGIQAKILERGLDLYLRETGSNTLSLRAAIGPGASACCYEVGWDVAQLFSKHYPESLERTEDGKYLIDLKGISRKKLVSVGILSHNIDTRKECTICDSRFHSIRRDREIELRQISVAFVSRGKGEVSK